MVFGTWLQSGNLGDNKMITKSNTKILLIESDNAYYAPFIYDDLESLLHELLELSDDDFRDELEDVIKHLLKSGFAQCYIGKDHVMLRTTTAMQQIL